MVCYVKGIHHKEQQAGCWIEGDNFMNDFSRNSYGNKMQRNLL